jgi:hypothetical protein|tara:strand:+ start:716 stop:1162 length:447 start_codon:yes stop_codon:yes gene_type:complete
MARREQITSKIVELLKAQRSVRFGKVERDPVDPSELAKTAFPALYVETTDEDIEDIAMGGGTANNPLRMGSMEVAVVLLIGGKQRDTQKNIAVEAAENTIMSDRTLDGTVEDIRLTRVEAVVIGESAPFTTCRMIFTVEYCYTITKEE